MILERTMEKNSTLTKKMLSNAGIYGLGMTLAKLGGFLVLPLYWSVLTPEDFGLIAIFQIVYQFLTPLYDLGLSGALQRLFYEWPQDERKNNYGAIWVLTIGFGLGFSILLSGLANSLLGMLFQSIHSPELIYAAIWMTMISTLITVPNAFYRTVEQAKTFSILNLSQFILQIILTLYFLYETSLRHWGYIYAQMISTLIIGVISNFLIWKHLNFRFTWQQVKAILHYAIPTFPSTFLDGVGQILDRFFLEKIVSLGTLGLYNLGRQLGAAYNMFLQMMKTSWFPMIYRVTSERKDAPSVLAKMSYIYAAIVSMPAVIFAMTAKDIIILLNRSAYFSVADYIPLAVFGFWIQGLGQAYGRGLDLAKKTSLYWVIYAFGIPSYFIALIFLTPKFTVFGALWSFVISIFVRELAQTILGHIYYPRPIYWGKIGFIVLWNGLICLLLYQINVGSPLLNILVKTVVGLTMTAILFVYLVGFKRLLEVLKHRKNRLRDLLKV
jgi:O-antigen/teichoic acid export membrane protein